MKMRLRKFENELHSIDGPQHTWNLKKLLRRKVSQLHEQISAARPFDQCSGIRDQRDVWIPSKPYELSVGDQVMIASACYDEF